MNESELFQQYQELIRQINKHNLSYYNDNAPSISDYEYDILYHKLLDIEKSHPEFRSENSPTQKIGAPLQKTFAQVHLSIPMMSLDNTYSEAEILDFLARTQKMLKDIPLDWTVEPKVDGLSVNIRYEKGILTQAATRGNGYVGDDITLNLKTISSLPHKLIQPVPNILELRGEVYLPRKEFERLNAEREMQGIAPFANPRNAAAGSLKLLDPKEVSHRNLHLLLYGLGEVSHEIPTPVTQIDLLNWMRSLGVPVFPVNAVYHCNGFESLIKAIRDLDTIRHQFGYDTDGAVVKLNSFSLREDLGMTAKAPRWAVAYKYKPEQVETVLQSITIQVGRTGILTPVAELSPVELCGTTISRATLHNENYLKDKDIRIGDRVIIEKAGEIIPVVIKSLHQKRKGDEKPFEFPDHCPVCKTKTERRGTVAWCCPNEHCPGKIKTQIEYWCSRGAMDITGGGEGFIGKLVDNHLIQDVSDLYLLTLEQISPLFKKVEDTPKKPSNSQNSFLPGFETILPQMQEDKKLSLAAKKFLNSVHESKKRDLWCLIAGLGIPNVGSNTAKLLAQNYPSLDELAHKSIDELSEIQGLGPIIAESIVKWFASAEHQKLIEKLRSAGLNFQSSRYHYSTIAEDGNFKNKYFAFTGTLSLMSRDEAKICVEQRGGKIASSLSKKTDYLVVGDNPGSKLQQAQELGITILYEKDFQSIIS